MTRSSEPSEPGADAASDAVRTAADRADRALRLALACYPARFRREHGDELTAIHHEATADATRTERLREAVDLAASGLRQRLGLGSAGPLARLAATSAPMALAVMLGALSGLVRLEATSPGIVLRARPPFQLDVVQPLLWVVALAAAWFGRWSVMRAAAVLAALAVVVEAVYVELSPRHFGAQSPLLGGVAAAVFTAALVLAPPRDLLGATNRHRWVLTLSVVGAALPYLVGQTLPYPYVNYAYQGEIWAVVLAFTLPLAAGRADSLGAALPLAVLPAVLHSYVPTLHPMGRIAAAEALLIAVAAAVAVLRAVLLRRSPAPLNPPPGTAG